MAAPTNAAEREESPCQLRAVHTWPIPVDPGCLLLRRLLREERTTCTRCELLDATGWTGDRENPLLGHAPSSAGIVIGTRSADHIRASGHERRANSAGHMTCTRPQAKSQKSLDPWVPSTHDPEPSVPIQNHRLSFSGRITSACSKSSTQ